MTQREMILKHYRRVAINEPGCPIVQCQFVEVETVGICGNFFETDTSMSELWRHLKQWHRVGGEYRYHGLDSIAVFSLKDLAA